MGTAINKEVLHKLCDNDAFNKEIYDFISKALDDELLKPENEMDCDFICWCTNSLIELEEQGDNAFKIIIPLFTDNGLNNSLKRINFKSLSRGTRALIAACLTMFFAVTANAAVDKIFDVNIAERIVDAISGRISESRQKDTVIGERETEITDDADNTRDKNESVGQKDAEQAEKIIKSDIVSAQSEKKAEQSNSTAPEAVQEVTVLSVQGDMPGKLVYTTQDNAVDLSGLRLRYVYSNGTYSKWFGSERVKIKNDIDFGKQGVQDVVLIIDGTYEYSYKILIKNSEIKDDKIKSVKLGHTGSVNFVFSLNEEPDLSRLYLDVTYFGGKREEIYYKNCDEMSVAGINTTIETIGSTKQFTVYYKGFTVNAGYVVTNRNTEAYQTAIIQYEGRYALYDDDVLQTPKTLYYYGEPLNVGRGIKPDMQNDKSVSCNPFADGDEPEDYEPFLNYGFTVCAKNMGSGGYVFYDSDELDIYGYDPYKLGFQTLDVYFNGIYLLSYNVFVYGDDGFCPSNTVDAFVDYGDESQFKIDRLYKCIGDGKLQTYHAYYDELYSDKSYSEGHIAANKNPVYKAMISGSMAVPDDAQQTGWQNAVCTFGSDSYELRMCQRYDILRTRINYGDSEYFEFDMNSLESPDFGNATVTLTIKNVGDVTYSINDLRTVPRIINDGSKLGSVIDKSLELESAFVRYQVMFDRESFRLDNNILMPSMIPAFVYEKGFENSITLDVRAMSSYDEYIYDIKETESSLIERYDYYLVSKNNTLRIGNHDDYDNCVFEIKGVDFGKVGEYDGVIYTQYNGRMLEAKRHYIIVEKLVTPSLEPVYDENKSKALLTGDKFVDDNTLFIYTNKKGDKISLSRKDVLASFATGIDDRGIITAQSGESIRVDYKYKDATAYVWYKAGI